jgi:hypothetical protein
MVVLQEGDATMRAKMSGKLKGIVVPIHPLTPAYVYRFDRKPHLSTSPPSALASPSAVE